MAATEAIGQIETLTGADVAGGLALSRETGWNQTDEDWRTFIESGLAFGRRDGTGRLIATAALLPSGRTAWISMVLTTAAHRRRGLAAGLMRHCIDEARTRYGDVFLDATPAGAAVYEKMGFAKTGLGLLRLRRKSDSPPRLPTAGCDAAALDRLCAQDARALGFDRSPILRRLAARQSSRILEKGGAIAMTRAGDRARHVGPVFAEDDDDAIDALRDVLSEPGETLIDIVDHRPAIRSFVESLGFAFERPFARMRLGEARGGASLSSLAAVAGPEFG